MREIYSNASSVVIWLGNEATNSGRGFEIIRRLSDLQDASREDDALYRPIVAQELEELGLPDVYSPDWKAVDALYWRAWFSRVWIIQEITLAKSATIFCGPD